MPPPRPEQRHRVQRDDDVDRVVVACGEDEEGLLRARARDGDGDGARDGDGDRARDGDGDRARDGDGDRDGVRARCRRMGMGLGLGAGRWPASRTSAHRVRA